jgi:predicted phosphodiesterase
MADLPLRLLVMGDNHGNAETLEQVANETAGETFDYLIHVGDLTNVVWDGHPAEQVEAIRPALSTLTDRGELVYIWGNRDKWGDPMPEDGLGLGTLIEQGETRTIDGQRFTTDPEAVDGDTILLTHGEHDWAIDHFDGLAYFCGHTHAGRFIGRMLNSAFLYRDESFGAEPLQGGYFIVEISEDRTFDVEFRNLGGLAKVICPDHIERGIQFLPDGLNCNYCYNDGDLEKELLTSAFYALAELDAADEVTAAPEGSIVQSRTGEDGSERTAVHETALVEYACGLWDSPPAGFRESFTEYLGSLDRIPLAYYRRDGDGYIIDL